ncbi:MAG: hypothetical protein QOI50_141 [Pseudonocardiales bacterium]|jgi:hypothetical protein|nr:hypothetical protein [Pseudonocardiales bacterium]
MSSPADPDALRIGTAEREEAMRILGDHFAEGRLRSEEYETRVTAALEAETRGALRPLFADLPAPQPACLQPPAQFPPLYPPQFAPVIYPVPPSPAPYSPRSRTVAGVLQIVLPFGVGRFYTGHVGMAVAQLLLVLFTFGIGAVWPIVDGILLLVNGGDDPYGRRLRD